MDAKNIIMQGERAKYFVRSEKWNFSLEGNSYWLELLFGMQGKMITIRKSDFEVVDDKYSFSFPTTDMIGKVKARMVMEIFDPDCPDGVRQEIDEQYIGIVINNPCPQFFKCDCADSKHEIIYELAPVEE